MRKALIIYSIIIILSALGFSQTPGLISEIIDPDQHVVVYCSELMSSGNDDDTILTFWSVAIFSIIFIIAILPQALFNDLLRLLLVICLGGVQLLALSGGLEAGSVVDTLRLDKNIFLGFWICAVLSFIPVSIGVYIAMRKTTSEVPQQ
jgi:hypothetical protein